MFLYLVFSFPKAKRIPTFQPMVFSFPKIQLTHTGPSLCRIIEGKGEELEGHVLLLRKPLKNNSFVELSKIDI